MSKLASTDERAMPGPITVTAIEHLHRYAIAQEVCRGKAVLDVASGEGYGTNLLAQVAKSVVGVEIFSDAVAHAKSSYHRDNLEFMQGDICKLPNDSGVFDVVTCFETLEHVEDHEAAVGEIKRVLRRDGVILISTPCKAAYNATLKAPNPHHVKELEVDEFKALLSKYFKNVQVYHQRVFHGSLVISEQNLTSMERLYDGDFGSISQRGITDDSVYVIAVASDERLPVLGASAFQSAEFLNDLGRERLAIIERLEHEVQSLKNSASFRLGQKIINPLHKIKSLIRK